MSGLEALPSDVTGYESIRIEDDIAITDGAAEILSSQLPRDPDELEAWIAQVWAH